MRSQQELNYNRIADAIRFIKKNYRTQPKLEEIAEHINMSPFHFQRMFSEWAGTTPKRFLQYLNIEYAKKILKETHATLFDTACELGLSGTGRLHDLFINIEGMTPGEYKNGGLALNINYSFADTPFGKIIAASTDKGVCHMAFVDEGERRAFDHLRSIFPNAKYVLSPDTKQQHALSVFDRDWNRLEEIKLHLKGTEFQLKVWETLLKIPAGGLATYADLATKSGYNGACRAVGTAVGKNPVAFLIPCHRVIKATGEPGNYHWGEMRKNAIIAWEAAHKDSPDR
ncbi:methylated-DNA--[protein]-cysteine S-methyltransferase [Bacteroides sp.]|uniref:methylated-DNA--[protein]-cysteine S-methyltransferase n=1 Tax=Bacteroides sp. TaxID=29523 RepID=UPI004028DBCD